LAQQAALSGTDGVVELAFDHRVHRFGIPTPPNDLGIDVAVRANAKAQFNALPQPSPLNGTI
jgi:hypothetical protein